MKMTTQLSPVLAVSAAAVLAVSVSACLHDDDSPTNYREVGNAMYALLSNPLNFCSYVGTNMQAISTPDFDSCALSKLNSLRARLDEIQDECDAIFSDGYDRLKCDQDMGASEIQFGLQVLDQFPGLSDGTQSCSDLSAVFSFAVALYDEAINDINILNPNLTQLPTWNQLVTSRRSNIIEQYTCKF